MQNRTMPSNSIIPVLGYTNFDEALDWLCDTFGFTLRWKVSDHRAQLTYRYGTLAIRNMGAAQPGKNDKFQVAYHMLVRVPDLELHYQYSLEKGVNILQHPTDYPYGERQYVAEDIGGHHWTFSQSIADVLPEDWGGISGQL